MQERILSIDLEGSRIIDIPSFYVQINALLMVGEDWQLGNSLDAFDDLLYGGFGRLKDFDKLQIRWNDISFSQKSLGIETTRKYYMEKLKSKQPFNKKLIHQKLAELESGEGQTYFDILMEIIASHKNVNLLRG